MKCLYFEGGYFNGFVFGCPDDRYGLSNALLPSSGPSRDCKGSQSRHFSEIQPSLCR